MRILFLLCVGYMFTHITGNNIPKWKGCLNVSAGVANIYDGDRTKSFSLTLSTDNFTFTSPEALKGLKNAFFNGSVFKMVDNNLQRISKNLDHKFISLCEIANKTDYIKGKYYRFNRFVGPSMPSINLNTSALYDEPNVKNRILELNDDLSVTFKCLHVVAQGKELIQARLEKEMSDYYKFQEDVVTDFLEAVVFDKALKPVVFKALGIPNTNLVTLKILTSACTANVLNVEFKAIYGNDPIAAPVFQFKSPSYFLNATFIKPRIFDYYVIHNHTMQALDLIQCFQETINTFHCPQKALYETECTPTRTFDCDNEELTVAKNFIDIEELGDYVQIASLIKAFTIFNNYTITSFNMPKNGKIIVLLNQNDRLQFGYRIFNGKSPLPTKIYFQEDMSNISSISKTINSPNKTSTEPNGDLGSTSILTKHILLLVCVLFLIIVLSVSPIVWYCYAKKIFSPL